MLVNWEKIIQKNQSEYVITKMEHIGFLLWGGEIYDFWLFLVV